MSADRTSWLLAGGGSFVAALHVSNIVCAGRETVRRHFTTTLCTGRRPTLTVRRVVCIFIFRLHKSRLWFHNTING